MARIRTVPLALLLAGLDVLASCLSCPALGQSILTVAGGGTDDGRLATQVRLSSPAGLARMPDGALVLSEMSAHRIRRVDPATGRISTFAGNGIGTFAGDGGPAATASLYAPSALLLHEQGLLVADAQNLRIRRIDLATHEISTWAGGGDSLGDGGPARAARFNCPVGLAKAAGGIFVADACAARIRRIDAATGIVTTAVGTGESGFSGDGGPATAARIGNPRGIAVDRAGNLLVVDTTYLRVRRVLASSGIIETIAGDGSQAFREGALALETGFLQPYSVAEDTDGNLWVGDTGRVVRIAASTGRVSSIAAAGRADGLLPDGRGMLVADGVAFSSEVFRLDPATGSRVRLAGGGAGGLGDGGPATSAVLAFPYDVATTPDGGVVFPEADGCRVRKFRAGGTIETIAGTGSIDGPTSGVPATEAAVAGPTAVASDSAGNVYVATGNVIVRIDAATGLLTRFAGGGEANPGDGGPATAALLFSPGRIAVDGRGGLLVAERNAHRVRRVDLSAGIISTVAGTGSAGFSGDGGPATSARLDNPGGLDVDASGNVYLVDSSNSRIRRISATDGKISTVAGGGTTWPNRPVDALDAQLPGIWALASDRAGRLAFPLGTGLARFDPATNLVEPLGPLDSVRGSSGDGGPLSLATFASIRGLRFDSAGHLFIADGGSNLVRASFACGPVAEPALASPADGAAGTSTGPTLSWASVAGAFRYDVHLGTSNPPTTAVATDLAATSFTPLNLEPGTRHFWRVVARGDPFCVPPFQAASVVRSFTTASGCAPPATPVLVSPVDGAPSVAAPVRLSWEPVPGAESYDVYLGATNPPPLLAFGGTETSITPLTFHPVPGATYYWSIVAHAACDRLRTSSSPVRSFRVAGAGCPALGPFVTSAPADGATGIDPEVTLEWTASPNATSYDVYLGAGPSLPLYRAGVSTTRLALSGLSAGATYRWKVAARTSCDPAAAVETAVRSFGVRGTCAPPGGTSFTVLPPGPVGTGQTYVVAWSAADGLGPGGGYVVERSTSSSFSPLLDTVTTTTLFVSFLAPAPGSLHHRVRAVPACDPSRAGPWSETGTVAVVTARPNVVFSRAPEAVVAGLGERLEDRRTAFALENLSPEPVQVVVARQELSSVPFFRIADPAGGDAAFITLAPRVPRLLEIRYSGPPTDVPGSYQGLVVVVSTGPGLAVTPYAFVSLKVGSSPDAVPEFRAGGVPTEYAAFPGFSGDDTARPPIQVDVHNPGAAPLELAAEIGPEVWLSLEPGWNSTPIPAGGTRTLRLSTRRTRAPNGSALPRYTYLTLRTKGGRTARLLVQDNEAPFLSAGRGASPVRPGGSFLVPSVARVTSALGNTFVSRVALSNAGTEPVQAELVFTPASGDATLVDGFGAATRRATVVVPPNDVVQLSDPLVLLFGLSPPVSGTLEVRAPAARDGFLSVSSSVDAPARSGGTFGFALPVFRSGEGIRPGASAAITAVASDAAERTNLILAETTGVDAAVARVSLVDRNGALLGEERVTVPRWGQRQLSGVVPRLGGSFGLRAGRLEVSVESGGGTLAAVTTVVDNANDDASTFVARSFDSSGPAPRSLKPSWALATGTVKSLVPALVNGYQTFPSSAQPYTFRSVMGFTSLSTSDALFRLTYYDLVSGATLAREVRVPGRRSLEYSNVLEQLFGIGQGVKSQGPLFVESDLNGVFWCRVASAIDKGTIGDSFPVVPIPSEGLTGAGVARVVSIDGLEQSVDRSRGTRSNLLLNEVAGKPVTVTVSLYEAGNRTSPIAERDVSLKALEKVQLSTVFSDLGLDQESRRKDRTNVLCTVRPKSGEGLASAVVTTINNRTGDTRNVALAPNGAGAGGGTIGF